MNPRVSSSLRQRAAGPDSRREGNVARGRVIMICGPAGRGPTTPQLITNEDEAYELYGRQGPLARDIDIALRGASIGGSQSQNNKEGQVLAVRLDTGEVADTTMFAQGTESITFRTTSSGLQANDWVIGTEKGRIVITDPERNERIRIQFDPRGGTGSITTPSELAQAVFQATEGRLEAEVHRGRTHFELSVSEHTDFGGIRFQSSSNNSWIDFSDAAPADLAALTKTPETAIGREQQAFDGAGPFDPVHNFIVPRSQEDLRVYAISAGKVQTVEKGSQNVFVERLANANLVSAGTNTLLNLRSDGNSATEIPLVDVGSRNDAVTSEAYEKVRDHYVGRLDTTRVAEPREAFVDYTVQAAEDVDITDWLGEDNAQTSLEVDGEAVLEGEEVMIFGQGTDYDGIYVVQADGVGDLYLEGRKRTGSKLYNEGATLNVLAGMTNDGLKTYSIGTFQLEDAEVIHFRFNAEHGIADREAGAAGPLATAYAEYIGQAGEADTFSVDRLTPEGEYPFEVEHDEPIEITVEAVTGTATDTIEDVVVEWMDGEAHLYIDAAKITSRYDGGLVYVDYDSCIFDLDERNDPQRLGGAEDLEYAVEGQRLIFATELEHELVFRPLQVIQYELGSDLTLQRTSADGNRYRFQGRGHQPGSEGNGLDAIETILGWHYDYEPSFPPEGAENQLSGATTGLNANSQEQADALERALRQYGREEHHIIMASGLHVDEMRGGKDEVTGQRVNKPVGVLNIFGRHKRRTSEFGASPIVFASVRPMQPSTATGTFTDEAKVRRVAELVDGTSRSATPASIIQDQSREEVVLFDAPMRVNAAGRTVVTSSPALWAGLRSTLDNNVRLYELDLDGVVEPAYKYDVAGQNMMGRLSGGRLNSWSPGRGDVRLHDERTAAGFIADSSGQLQPNGWQSGLALFAAKQFQQDAVDELRNLLGGVGSGGIEVLRGTVDTMLKGIAQRTTGVQRLILDDQRDINIRSEGGGAIGMYITPTLITNGELKRIDLEVDARSEVDAGLTNEDEAAIPSA